MVDFVELEATTKRLKLAAWHGAKLMDEKRPGWYKDIVPPELNMALGNACILGQSYGWYSTGKERLNLNETEAQNYGFVLSALEPNQSRNYSLLTEAWLAEVHKREQANKFSF